MGHRRARAIARTPTSIPDTYERDWQPLPASEGNVPGPVAKLLSDDPETGAQTLLVHIPPGWHDEALDWHPCVEESFRLTGIIRHPAITYGRGAYIYRPPGLLHGPSYADRDLGGTGISRFDRTPVIRRALDRPHADHGQPVSDEYRASPAGYVEHLDTDALPWEEAPPGPWAGTRCKWLKRYDAGGGALLIDVPRGWSGPGSRARGTVEEVVVGGSVLADGERYLRWGYACRAVGAPAGSYASDEGALLLCYWETDELA